MCGGDQGIEWERIYIIDFPELISFAAEAWRQFAGQTSPLFPA